MIRKTVITLTILHPAGETPEGCSLGQIAAETDVGGWLGSHTITSSEIMPSNKVNEECLALGSDASFFNNDA